MDGRNVVVIKDSDDSDSISPIEEDRGYMEKKDDKIPYIDLNPSPPKKPRSEVKLKSKIQRAPETEDGEIVSSPEYDAADIEIKIHAEMTSSEEEDEDMEETVKVAEDDGQVSNKEKQEPEVIQVLDTPPEKDKKEFPQKEQPVTRKRLIVPAVREDHDVEIDHLDISAPLQSEVRRGKGKSSSKDSSIKSSPGKTKLGSPDSDRRKNKSPADDQARKRPYDVFDERKSRSDTEYEEKKRHSDKRSDHADDLRKHLLKKIGNEHISSRDKSSRNIDSNERRYESSDRNRNDHDRYDQRSRDNRSKEYYERSLTRDKYEKQSRDQRSREESSKNRDYTSSDRYRHSDRHSDSKRDSDTRDKNKYKKYEDRNGKVKKKKKRRHRDSESDYRQSPQREKIIEEEIIDDRSPEKDHDEEIETKEELTYDDISSEGSVESADDESGEESAASSERSDSDHSGASSPSHSENESLTPERSPTPMKKRSYYPGIEGCRDVNEFVWLNRIEEGTYGVVYRAKDRRTDEIVALKRLKMEKEREGFPITSLREINTLLKAQHPNIVTVREIVVGSNMDKIYIVMDYVEHDLKSLMETMTQPFLIGEVKTLMLQLLRGVRHMHDNWILHRDIKASNLLLSHKGILKIGDFGLAREYGSPLKRYTSIVVTLWYRAPELLLGQKEYSTAIDLWSCGCVFAELMTMKPLFPGKSEIDQINRIFKELGTPSNKIWPGPPAYSELPQVKKMNIADHPYSILRNRFGTNFTDVGYDLLNRLLTYDPKKRITAHESLQHEYFNESPKPVDPSMFPTWPAKSELGHRAVKKLKSPKPPEGGEFGKQGGEDGGFHMISTTKGSSAKSSGFNLRF